MSRLVLQMQSSIDGFVSSTVPGSRWQLWDWGPEWTWSLDLRRAFNAVFADAAAILLSPMMLREGYLDHWTRMGEEHRDDPDWAFARRIAELPVFVPSREPRDLPDHPHVRAVPGPLAETVPVVRDQADGDVLCFGGAGLGAALVEADLVDELQLFVNPGLAGEGERIFSPAVADRRLRPLGAEAYECGVVVTRWAREARV